MIIKKRTFVRIVSFLAAAVVALGGYSIYKTQQTGRYRISEQNEYARNFADLSEHLYNIETAFEKGQYAGSDYQIVRMANQVWRETGAAKTALEGMPEHEAGLYEVSEFLSKAGDYAYYVSSRIMKGETAAENEAENMRSLAFAAAQLANYVGNLRTAVDNGEITVKNKVSLDGFDADVVGDEWSSVQEQVSEYPELIYDGPFSDHIEKMEPILLSGAAEITEDEAKARLAQWLGVSADKIKRIGEMDGKIRAWTFEVETRTASVTKQGGYLLELTDSRERVTTGLSIGDAMNKAQEFFAKMGITGMRQSYYMKKNGEITMNFAYSQDGVIVYPDLIKVSVCLETGDICGYEAYGYLMAHRTDRDTGVALSVEQAQEKVNANLHIISRNVAIIPTDGKNEVLCHEFVTETAEGKHVLVYVNAKTGIEEMIQILIETDDGTLTV